MINIKHVSYFRITISLIGFLLIVISVGGYIIYSDKKQITDLTDKIQSLNTLIASVNSQKDNLSKTLENLEKEDQVKKNKELQSEIENINSTYIQAVQIYEKILDFNDFKKTEKQSETLAKSLSLLSQRNYASASANLNIIDKQLADLKTNIATEFKIPTNIAVQNSPPGAGHRKQQVEALGTTYLVDIVSADLNTTKVIVDTASDSDCKDNCPVLSLSEYVSRSGAFAGINGSYFCPATYPSCVGKANSFDTLIMNKNKKYINSDNNVYSTVPAVIFSGNSARFVGQSLEWGRDTGVDAVLANYPMMVSGGNVVFGGNNDPKQGSKGPRAFVGHKDSTVYIGIVHNATVAEAANVLKALGLQAALNLDSGGSTALWSGGYKYGPGRNIPNALLFVKK